MGDDGSTVYTLQSRTRLFGLAGFLGVVGVYMLVVVAGRPTAQALEWFGALFVLALGPLFAYVAAVTQLTVSASGLDYQGPLGSLHADWDQVVEIKQVVGRGRRDWGSLEDLLVLANSRQRITLNDFAPNWRGSPLGADLRKHAPHLFKQHPGHHARDAR